MNIFGGRWEGRVVCGLQACSKLHFTICLAFAAKGELYTYLQQKHTILPIERTIYSTMS